MKRWQLVALVCCALVALGGVAKAAEVLGHGSSETVDKEQRLQTMAEQRHVAEGVAQSAKTRGPRGRRGPRGLQGAPGARGAAGPVGPIGPAGPKGAFSSIIEAVAPNTYLCGYELLCSIGSSSVQCPPGTTVISGGWSGLYEGIAYFSFKSGNGWAVGGANWNSIPDTEFRAIAMCASP